ncbi:Peptidoglycan/LPS O-acetylase OafA/YrhL, contains acyltransferase and SGNH-hydrolase domains [Ruminococcus flavefaciens]|uniref:Peptidoglycan/LPS O-acetylase OafA/YrhL, contains acyltransferase and SGNH-hydrolase domains n=1 Tax=Ruminococcus flavefaciens TaxID=1265 RepID=A0A1H6JUI7_RUMFL|nr:acyltransferase [Ruminococcus flavefaciens]SEH64645.1 Peptidoglycan/LPS O-acetylase OafA/YrhL, contains acyltransferase and SGNH-hydrolase domains [Ruminococcus flavefaciens]
MDNKENISSGAKRNLIGFDVLKIIASSFIVLHHYQQVFNLQFDGINFYGGVFNFGYFVELFFIISGYLTLYSDKLGGAFHSIKYKLLRFFPITTIACFFTLIVKSVLADDIFALWNWKALIANFLLLFSGYPYFSMIGINNPTWYLCVLIQCFMVYYLIREISNRLHIPRIWLDCVVVGCVIALKYISILPDSTYRALESFSIGLIICGLEKQKLIKKSRYTSLVLLILLAFSAMSSLIISSQQRRILTFVSFPALIILCIFSQFDIIEKYKSTITVCGKVSFEVYIWHYPLMATEQMISRISGIEVERCFMTMFLFLLVIWILAYLLYRFVETPINTLIKRKQD